MQPLNAIDAISPAFTRTHQLLFPKPFNLGRAWKLAASQYLGLMGGMFLPLPLFFLLVPRGMLRQPFAVGMLVAAVFYTLVLLVLFYLGIRMQFVAFEMIVTRERMIAPMWRRYGKRVWPFFWFKVILGTVLTLVMLPLVSHLVRGFIATIANFPRFTPGQAPDPMMFQAVMVGMVSVYGVMFLFFFVLKGASTLVEDFALPFYILEPISWMEAMRRGSALFAADPLGCLLYLFMKLVLSIFGFIVQYVANFVCAIPAVIVLFIGIFAGALLFGHHDGSSIVLAIAGAVVLYGIVLAYMVFVAFGLMGYLFTLLEAYATYFVGSRYPTLGNLLEPPTPQYIYAPPPTSPPPASDEDDGPSLPMDPALA